MAYVPADTPLSILVVDDERSVREMLTWMLSDAGHLVREASNGLEALGHLRTQGPVDVVLSDINMPYMDGIELARELRQHWPGLPVVLISGRPPPVGVPHFIPKPFRWDALSRVLTDATKSGGTYPIA